MTDLLLVLDRRRGHLATQLASELRAAIRSGRLAPGLRLPATRTLARDLGVSRGVVVEAYDQLIAEGFLVARQGDCTRVASPGAVPASPPAPVLPPVPVPQSAPAPHSRPTLQRASNARPSTRPDLFRPYGREVPRYDLRPGTPDLAAFPRQRWASLVRRVLNDLPADALGYPDPAGVPALRAGLAAYLRRVRAAQAEATQVVVLSGVAQGIAALASLLRRRHELPVVAIEDPSSPGEHQVLRAAGIEPIGVPVDDEGLDVEYLNRTRAHAALVTPAHQYPTGVVLSPRRRAALVAWARERDALIIEDDYDAEFRYDREPVGCLQGLAPDHVVLLGSVSKSLAPGFRIGWAVAPAEVAAELGAYRAVSDLGSPVLEQHTLAAMLSEGYFDRHVRTMRRTYRARRDALVGELTTRLPWAPIRGVSAGLHVYVDLADLSEDAVVSAARERGVAVEGGRSTWLAADNPPPALILGYARLPERRIAEAVALLAEVCPPRT
ncbi:PLP-dependent aminotransferase family protein [Actinopolymorpha alba]|uniref:MocR-like pyridoxine biosynthesis transcription factor PdxR n=1 Tax=Actinopolymorpha alba TaxID=533267 RepID=UPI00036134B6|nr:PLP-dependent aminotransferase family protein [Actinopolymorpha alba]